MELTKSGQKETRITHTLAGEPVTVPAKYSRLKAIKHAKENGGNPVPELSATKMLYMMFMKIGAKNELPSETKLQDSYLNDFWLDLYLNNHLCPGDIPFHIIIKMFTTAMVQGVVERKGNNQAAICGAFNKWITREDVRTKLYQKRDEMYPYQKPKQIPETATQESIEDYSDEELLEKHNSIEPMKGITMVNMMLKKLEEEIKKRGL